MKLFGWKSGRDESRPVLSRALNAPGFQGAFGDVPYSYEAQVRAGYLGNTIVQRAVKLVVECVGSAPLLGSDPALVALVTARSGGQALVETVAAQMLLHGNAYVQVLRDIDGGAAELFALRPERVAVEADASGWPAAYRYRVGERVTRLHADPVRPEVIHLKSFNPVDDHYGLGCLGDATPVETRCAMRGASVVPPSPVHLRSFAEPDGSATVKWTRRGRAGWRWIDGVDAPLSEEVEAYRVTVTAGGTAREVEMAVPFVAVTAAERAASASVAVRQRGIFGESLAADLIVPA